MSGTPNEKIIAACLADLSDRVHELIDEPDCGMGNSPIEKIMFAAISTRARFSHFDLTMAYATHGQLLDRSDKRSADWFYIAGQVPLLDEQWKVDFVVSVKDPFSEAIAHLVVECDGHDFHERTKKQAARDRDRDRRLQVQGFTIFRFTGSEIFNDPVRCATAVLDWVSEAYWGFVTRGLKLGGAP